MKKCPKCGLTMPDSARDCLDCGFVFPKEVITQDTKAASPQTKKTKKPSSPLLNNRPKRTKMPRATQARKSKFKIRNFVVGVIVLFILFALLSPGKDNSTTTQTAKEDNSKETTKAEKVAADTPDEDDNQDMLKFDDEKYHSEYIAAMDTIIGRYANVDTHMFAEPWTFADFDGEDNGIVVGMTKVDVDGMVAKQDVFCVFETDPDYNTVCHYLYCTELLVDDGVASDLMRTFNMPTKSSGDDKSRIDDAIAYADSVLSENFADCYEISCEDDVININIWQDGVAANAILASAGNTSSANAWEIIKSASQSISSSVYKKVDGTNAHVVVNILNNQNHDNTLLTYMDGSLAYDSVSQ